MQKRSLGPKTLMYPLPAFLVGTYDAEGKPNIMTLAWGGICCSEPPLVNIAVRRQRWSHNAIVSRKAFTISIPAAEMASRVDFAGIATGENTDKFAALSLTPVKAEFVDAPYVSECPVILELSLHSSTDLGSHVLFIGEIKDVKVNDDCLDERGKPLLSKIDPLLYDGGAREYFRAGGVMGKAFAGGKIFWKQTDE